MQDTKKVAGELLVELEKKGVTFETVDGKLKYKDSKGNFTENSKEKVKKYKEEIKTVEQLEKEEIEKAIKKYGSNTQEMKKVADALNIGIATLYRKVKKYNIK